MKVHTRASDPYNRSDFNTAVRSSMNILPPMHYPLTPGTTFRPQDRLPADVLCAALAQTVSFLQQPDPTLRLRRFADWLQHDGLMFEEGVITFHDLFKLIATPRALLSAMTGDFEVRLGVAPAPAESADPWYLRFILDWDDDEVHLIGEFDLTLSSPSAAEAYLRDVVGGLPFPATAEDAQPYFRRITESE